MPADRIHELGASDNFWSMGETGPCGRCSEIHYFRGNDLPCSAPVCLGPACDCDRFVEVWNNVFMEFDRQADGSLQPLPKPSIDTGMGLERIAAIKKGTLSNYDTDVFEPLLQQIEAWRGGSTPTTELATALTPQAISTRVIADHVRATTFLIADGVLPSNEWRGYVLRKIMRRAMRQFKHLGFERLMLHDLAAIVANNLHDAYPELRANIKSIQSTIRQEEQRFDTVLSASLPKLEELLDRAATSGSPVSGDEAFKLYDTFGLPLDFIEDMASERKLAFDRASFDAAMEGQREKARAKSAFDGKKADDYAFASPESADRLRASKESFEGYTTTTVGGARILAVFDDKKQQVRELATGQSGVIALDRTPFYLEAGGQVSDVGTLQNEAGTTIARVTGVVRLGAGLPRGHRVTVVAGPLGEGQSIEAVVDVTTRDATRRNHTATHLLHAALRQVLGPHVKQAGSLVAPDRLRFDFTHTSAITPAELAEIEDIVNAQILRNSGVSTEVRNTEEAIKSGAMALFGEKYGDQVRVVSIPGFSTELCGGTHTKATGDIGLFTITEESGVAAGVRRIEAQTGTGALHDLQAHRDDAQEGPVSAERRRRAGGRRHREAPGGREASGARGAGAEGEVGARRRRGERCRGHGHARAGQRRDVRVPQGRRARSGRAPATERSHEGSVEDRRRRPGVGRSRESRLHRRVDHARFEGALPRWKHRQGAGASRRRQGRRASRFCRSRRLGCGKD